MDITPENGSLGLAAANRKSFLLLRWLLIILAAYLTLFTNIEEPTVGGIFLLVTAFALSNVLISLLSLQVVMASKSRHVLAAVDSVFICAFIYTRTRRPARRSRKCRSSTSWRGAERPRSRLNTSRKAGRYSSRAG